MEKLVSIITPCFNGQDYISRFLDSILAQTYSQIEMIIIDDGSTDNTAEIIGSYKKYFDDAGYSLIYIYQENSGQASAINKGLAVFKGDFLTWPDSDDILSRDSIKEKVIFLTNNSEYGCVRSDVSSVDESDIKNVVSNASEEIDFKNEWLFDDLILENNVYFCPGGYMVPTKAFIAVNPSKRIYESKAGQNWQMLLPVFQYYKCGYIDKSLYFYVVRGDSHSHIVVGKEKEISRCDAHEDILLNVINSLNVDRNKYTKVIIEKYKKKRFHLACKFNDCSLAINFYRLMEKKNLRDFLKLVKLNLINFKNIGKLN